MQWELMKAPEKKKLIIVGIVVLGLLVFLLAPIFPTEVVYTTEKIYERTLRYEVLSVTLDAKWDPVFGVYHVMEVEVKNVDNLEGMFEVCLDLFYARGSLGQRELFHSLGPGETHIFSDWWKTSLDMDYAGTFTVISPTVVERQLATEHKTERQSVIQIIF